jgi:TonB-linked SusC/RagA family outer membrane protein
MFIMKWRQLLTTYVLPCLLLLLSVVAQAQTRVVTGKVTDAKDGTPLVGASVTVKGGKRGAVTDIQGSFTFKVSAAVKTLVISSVGYQAQEISVDALSEGFPVKLLVGSSDLNDVVVIGYGTVQKKDLTGAVSSVNSKDFQQGAITTPDQLIAGKIAGVSVTPNGGQPGSSSTIRIRGLASLNGNNDPLYVLDGAILPPVSQAIPGVSSPLDMIDPDDIANITVLKDAASEAIYGSRASAGVIIITTKKGKAGKPIFNVNSQYTAGMVAKQESVLSASQLRNLVESTPGDSAAIPLMGNANTNWQKQIYQTALTTNTNLSISGTTKGLPYRFSVGYTDQTGLAKTDQLKRGTAGLHLSPHLLNNHLSIELNVIGGVTQSRFSNPGAVGSAIAFDPTQPVYTANKGQYGGYFEWTSPSGALEPLSTRNPVALLEQDNRTGYAANSIGNLKLDYELPFLPGLHVVYNIGYDISEGHGFEHVPAYAAQQATNTSTQVPAGAFAPGLSSNYKTTAANTFNEFSLDYKRDLKSIKSNIDVLGTYGYYNNSMTPYSYASFSAAGDTLSGTTPVYPSATNVNTLISYIGRAIYTYDNKYIVQASIRDDGSSRFGPAYRWGVFPTVAGAWRLSQENFLKNTRWLDELKVRASYGVTGNQDGIGDYTYIPSYSLSSNQSLYPFGETYYYMYAPAAYDAGLKWEQTASTNLGLDFGIFNNRITGSVDFYYKNISNLLNAVNLPAGTNFTNIYTINIGSMTDKGAEVNLNIIPVKTKQLEWDVNFNFAYNKNTITKLTNNSGDTSFFGDATGGISGATGQDIQIQTVGYSPNSFFVLQQIYGKNGKPLEGAYVDQNRNGQITEPYDQIHYHSPFAPVIMGFSTSVNYQKWTFSLVARANIGNYVYNNVDASQGVTRYIYNSSGPFVSNVMSDYSKTGFYANQYQSSYYVQNASFLKVDNIGVAYNVGKVYHRATLRLSANCQNVFVITKYSGIDPEVYGGIDNNEYPRPRNFTIGASINY